MRSGLYSVLVLIIILKEYSTDDVNFHCPLSGLNYVMVLFLGWSLGRNCTIGYMYNVFMSTCKLNPVTVYLSLPNGAGRRLPKARESRRQQTRINWRRRRRRKRKKRRTTDREHSGQRRRQPGRLKYDILAGVLEIT